MIFLLEVFLLLHIQAAIALPSSDAHLMRREQRWWWWPEKKEMPDRPLAKADDGDSEAASAFKAKLLELKSKSKHTLNTAATAKLDESDGVLSEGCKAKTTADEHSFRSIAGDSSTFTSGLAQDTVYPGDLGRPTEGKFGDSFNTRTAEYSKPLGQKTTHFWGGMSDTEYNSWAIGIFRKAAVPRGGVVIDSGAGAGKFLGIGEESLDTLGFGVEPAPLSVCAGNRIFPRVDLRKGGANNLSPVPDSVADLAVSVGVFEYFPNITYLCQAISEQVRVVKPGGAIMNMWVLDAPRKGQKGDDKLNIRKDFWGNGDRALPACAEAISTQIDNTSLEFCKSEAWCGPDNGYSIFMRKKIDG